MDAAGSFEFDQPALLQIPERLSHVPPNCYQIDIVVFGEIDCDFVHCASVTTGNDFLRRLVQFENGFREKQKACAGPAIDLHPNTAGEPRSCVIGNLRNHDEWN